MSFQSTVGYTLGYGVAGEPAYDTAAVRTQPGVLNSADPTLNIFGRAAVILAGATGSFPVAGDAGANPKALSVGMGVAGVFAGILAYPKNHALIGTTAGGTLAPASVVGNGANVELAVQGHWVVSLPAASNPGDVLYFKIVDGTLATAAPGAAIPAGCAGPIGNVERFVNAAASLAAVWLEPRIASVAP